MGKQPIKIKEPPSIKEVEKFWKKIWSNEKEHNEEAECIKREEERMTETGQKEWEDIELKEVEFSLKKSHKWKSPGLDKLPNFWLNILTSTHKVLTHTLSQTMKNPEEIPERLAKDITYLLPKVSETNNPRNYRPIICLSTTCKQLTSIITERTYSFLEQKELQPYEQKGCQKGSYECKDQLLINRMIIANCHKKKRSLSTAWIDYRKVFNSVPHSWILKSLDIYKVLPVIINFFKNSMKLWSTNLFLNHTKGSMKFDKININCGIFQGDSLSPLLFFLSLIPLTNELNNTKYGYEIYGQVIKHLFYMDDLKLYAKNDKELEGLLSTVKQFSDDIGMEFGLDKCAKASFIKGELSRTTAVELDIDTTIRELDQDKTCKYLGIDEGNGIRHSKMKEMIRRECYRQARVMLKTELNSANKIEAINTLAMPVVQCSFNIIKWTLQDLRRIDKKIRKLLTCYKMHHPKADKDRLYLPRSEGGRSLIQTELTYKTATIGLHKYLQATKDWLMELVRKHENSKKLYSIAKESRKYMRELNIEEQEELNQDWPQQKLQKQ